MTLPPGDAASSRVPDGRPSAGHGPPVPPPPSLLPPPRGSAPIQHSASRIPHFSLVTRHSSLVTSLLLLLLLPPLLWHLLARLLPFPYDPFQTGRPATFAITAADGTPLRLVLPPDTFDYRPLYRASLSDPVVQALIAVEDARFLRHRGLDPLALLRALAQNLFAGRRLSGASTLSTQVIRLLRPAPRTLPTKLREAFQATQLEQRYTKTDILTAYLRLAPFGGNIIGIDAAADRYFATTPSNLALHEAALLAGLPQSPSRSRPDRRPDRALLRRSYVLSRMAACGYITPDQAAEADAAPLALRTPPPFPSLAPHFTTYVLRHLPPSSPPPPDGRSSAGQGGPGAPPPSSSPIQHSPFSIQHSSLVTRHSSLPLPTTLSLPLQSIAENALRDHLSAPPFSSDPTLSGAVVILSATNAAILAMVGSPDYDALPAGQFNAALAPRSVGSTLKPFLYALAFDRGLAAPATLLSDSPIAFADFLPQNYSRQNAPSVTAREALLQSLNLPAIRLLQTVTPSAFHHFLTADLRLPLPHPPSYYGLALALGAPDIPLLSLANAYCALAHPAPLPPASPFPPDGRPSAGPGGAGGPPAAPTPAPPPPLGASAPPIHHSAFSIQHSPISPSSAYLISHILSGPDRPFDATGHAADVPLPSVAWKTGTSASLRDAWTIAWTPEYVVGVWIGHPSGAPSPLLVGSTAAAPLAWAIFRHIYPDNTSPPFLPPPDIQTRTYCPLSGQLATQWCPPPAIDDLAIAGRTPHTPCPLHLPGYAPSTNTPASQAQAAATPATPSLAITHPAPGSELIIPPSPPDAPPSPLPLTLTTDLPGPFYWFMDDTFLAHAPSPLLWPPTPGPHTLVVLSDTPSLPPARSPFTLLLPP